jgi:succinyl-diaminopimelate desuccinylase
VIAEALALRLESLCAIPSPIGEEKALCDEVERWARDRFPRVRRVKSSLLVLVDGAAEPGSAPPSAVGAQAGSPERPLVALCGHLDTVPIHPDDRGKRPARGDGKLVAPGASDMKSGLAVSMELAERMERAGRFCDLALAFYAREEGPFLENELGDLLSEAPELRRAALAVCLEPTDNRLELGCMGSIHATLAFSGKSAHSARPWQGENAIHRAGALLAELSRQAPRQATSEGFAYREVMSVTRIEGGRARNIVPGRCTLNLNFRFAPDKSLEAAAAEVRALAAHFGAEAELVDLSPACPAFGGHPLVMRLRDRAGARVEPKQAWTDVARLAQAGIPAVNFGPGASSQAHQRGEWVELSALEESYRMLERFLRA